MSTPDNNIEAYSSNIINESFEVGKSYIVYQEIFNCTYIFQLTDNFWRRDGLGGVNLERGAVIEYMGLAKDLGMQTDTQPNSKIFKIVKSVQNKELEGKPIIMSPAGVSKLRFMNKEG